jgi:hypothetical protein
MMVDPCSNHPISCPFRNENFTGKLQGQRPSRVDDKIEKAQTDAGDKDGRHRHQCDELADRPHPCANENTLVPTEELRHACQCSWIDAPSVAPNVGYPFHAAVVRCVKTVIQFRQSGAA